MRRALLLSAAVLSLWLLPAAPAAEAAPAVLTYHWRHFLYTVRPQAAWQGSGEVWTYDGVPVIPAPEWTASGGRLPRGVAREAVPGWNRSAIAETLRAAIAEQFDREPREVTIRTASGKIVFDGVGLPGRRVDLEDAVTLTIAAMEGDIDSVSLPVTELAPKITVADEKLREMGIKEYVTVGESDYSNSPANRRHNIAVGVSRFNGHVIPKGAVFSFNEVLGPVNGSTGYLRELVIKGDKTVPDYGGGLCQISSTAYRGVWEYGFPIVERRNHSFAVNHYAPQGTDATIYPGAVDMKFKNDSQGALLIQTHLENDEVYYIYYGTRDDRRAEVLGPYVWARVGAPPERREVTTDLAPGQMRKVGEAVGGMKTNWFRIVRRSGTGATLEKVYSAYQARPRYFLVGAEAPPPDAAPVEDIDAQLDPLQ